MCSLLALMLAAVAGQPPLTPAQMEQATVLGRQCQAPIIRLPGRQLDVYVETPFGRAALVMATAIINHRPLDERAVRTALTSDYRIWAVYTDLADRSVSLRKIGVRRPGGPEMRPTREREWERLFLGIGGSHGIIEPLRLRPGEAIFDDLPLGNFEVVLHTSTGVQRRAVTDADRTRLLRVCN
jgi:hypothetical protein